MGESHLLYSLIFFLCDILCISNALESVKRFQFECVRRSGAVTVCLFPEQYCDSIQKECRPCSKAICDTLGENNFPLQCYSNCTSFDGPFLKTGENLPNPFIYNNAIIWFILDVFFVSMLLVTVATCPIWKKYLKTKWLEEKQKRTELRTVQGRKDEKKSLIQNGETNATSLVLKVENETPLPGNEEQNIPLKDLMQKDNGKDSTCKSSEQSYCKRKLQNVNPTEESQAEKNKVATTRSRLPAATSETEVQKVRK